MDKKTLFGKLKEILSEEDLKTLEESIETLIDERVASKEEEMKNKYSKISEEYVEKKVAELAETQKKELEETYTKKFEELEGFYVEHLDRFLDNEISENISDEMLSKIAINEIAMPIVDGIKKLYEENFIQLNSNADVQLKQKDEEVKQLKEELSNKINENMELSTLCEKAAIDKILKQKTEGLSDVQVERVMNVFEGKNFDEIESKIDNFIEMVVEEENKKVEEGESKGKGDEDTKVVTESKKFEIDPILESASNFV